MEKSRLTGLSPEELEALLLLEPRVFADYRDPARGKFAIVYNFSETTDSEDSGFLKIDELARTGATHQIGICKGSTEHGYAGYEHSFKRLGEIQFYRIQERSTPVVSNITRIVPILVEGNVNTGSEAEALIHYVATLLEGDIGIVAPAFHLMRAFMTTVSAMFRLNRISRVYAIVGAPLPWTEKVRHSQGTLQNTRAGLVADELGRLEKYRAPEFGSMFSAREVLGYLDWRDSPFSTKK